MSNREYLIIIGKAPQHTEIYDLYEKKIYFNYVKDSFGDVPAIYTKVAPHIKLYPKVQIYIMIYIFYF